MITYNSDHVYILDCQTELYIWESKKANKVIKNFARDHLKVIFFSSSFNGMEWSFKKKKKFNLISNKKKKKMMENLPSWTIAETVKEEEEGLLFRMKFADWPEPGKLASMKERQSG